MIEVWIIDTEGPVQKWHKFLFYIEGGGCCYQYTCPKVIGEGQGKGDVKHNGWNLKSDLILDTSSYGYIHRDDATYYFLIHFYIVAKCRWVVCKNTCPAKVFRVTINLSGGNREDGVWNLSTKQYYSLPLVVCAAAMPACLVSLSHYTLSPLKNSLSDGLLLGCSILTVVWWPLLYWRIGLA